MGVNKTIQPSSEHLRFAVIATDIAMFTIRDGELLVRLIRVHRPPHFPNTKGLPGGLIHPSETAEQTSLRLIEQKGGIESGKTYIEQLYTFSSINRDPRGRVVAVAYIAFVPWSKLSDAERADTDDAWWTPVSRAKHLAYDHNEILTLALKRLSSRLTYTTLIQKVMPSEFTLTELEQAYATILGKNLDKRNFRKKILKLKVLKTLPKKRGGGRFRPARLYAFVSKEIRDIEVI